MCLFCWLPQASNCFPDKIRKPKSQFWEFFNWHIEFVSRIFNVQGAISWPSWSCPGVGGGASPQMPTDEDRRTEPKRGGFFSGWRMVSFFLMFLFMFFSLCFHDFSLFFMVSSTSNYPIVEKYQTLNWLLLVRMSCILSFDVSLRCIKELVIGVKDWRSS